MFSHAWWQQLFFPFRTPIRRKSGASTRLMEMEVLENRWVPTAFHVTANINIYITGSATTIVFTDPNRFDDGAISALHEIGTSNNFVAANLRSAVTDAHAFNGKNTIFLENNSAGTYLLSSANGGRLDIAFPGSGTNSLTIKDKSTGMSTINAQDQSRIFEVYGGGATTLDHLLLENGRAPAPSNGPAEGGAIFNSYGGNLTLTNDDFESNEANGYGGGESAPQSAYGGAIFNASGALLAIKNSTFNDNGARGGEGINGNNGAGAEGGAIFMAFSGAAGQGVSITASAFTGNFAQGGESIIETGGSADGGAIAVAYGGGGSSGKANNKLSILNNTFERNGAYGGYGGNGGGRAYGGAVFLQRNNTLNVINSTFAYGGTDGGGTNDSYGGGGFTGGGAIDVDGNSTATIVNSTIADNTAYGGSAAYGGAAFGGGISVRFGNATVNLVNDTIASNQIFGGESFNGGDTSAYGGGVANIGDNSINVLNTIIAQNQSQLNFITSLKSDDVSGSFVTFGHNLIGNTDGSSGWNTAAPFDDQTGSAGGAGVLDPGLNPNGLTNNGGGPTIGAPDASIPDLTIALLPTSPAINTADNGVDSASGLLAGGNHLSTLDTTRLTTDQRGPGFTRESDRVVDVGAYEAQLDLDKVYHTTSNGSGATVFVVPPPGLLAGEASFPPPPGTRYEVVLTSEVPGLTLDPNGDGGFTYIIPRGFSGTVTFTFTIDVVNIPKGVIKGPVSHQPDDTGPTNFEFTASIIVSGFGNGRGSAGNYPPFYYSNNTGNPSTPQG